jgi:5-methylcytosine-specific restriction protein A
MSGGWQGSNRRARLPTDWAERCAQVRARDRGVCYVCGQPGADAVDHKNPGDDHRLTNLGQIHQDVPPYCHRTKSAREGNAARAAIRAKRHRPREAHPGQRTPGAH